MNDNDKKKMKKLSRLELVEIIYELMKKQQAQEEEIARLTRELEDKRIIIDKAGSIAKASLELNEVFERAQAAADQYLKEVIRLVNEKSSEYIP